MVNAKQTALKILEIMLITGGVAGAFFADKIVNYKQIYLSDYSLFFFTTFLLFVLISVDIRKHLKGALRNLIIPIFFVTFISGATFAAIIGLPIYDFVKIQPGFEQVVGISIVGLAIILSAVISKAFEK